MADEDPAIDENSTAAVLCVSASATRPDKWYQTRVSQPAVYSVGALQISDDSGPYLPVQGHQCPIQGRPAVRHPAVDPQRSIALIVPCFPSQIESGMASLLLDVLSKQKPERARPQAACQAHHQLDGQGAACVQVYLDCVTCRVSRHLRWNWGLLSGRSPSDHPDHFSLVLNWTYPPLPVFLPCC